MFLRNSLRMSLATQTPQRPLRIRRSFPSSGEISIPAMRAQKTTSTALRYAVSRAKDARRQLRSSVSRNNVKCECCRFSSNGQRGRVGAALPSLKRCCAHGEFAWFIFQFIRNPLPIVASLLYSFSIYEPAPCLGATLMAPFSV